MYPASMSADMWLRRVELDSYVREVLRSETIGVHPEKAVAVVRDLAHGREYNPLLPCQTSDRFSDVGRVDIPSNTPTKKRPATAMCRPGREMRGCRVKHSIPVRSSARVLRWGALPLTERAWDSKLNGHENTFWSGGGVYFFEAVRSVIRAASILLFSYLR